MVKPMWIRLVFDGIILIREPLVVASLGKHDRFGTSSGDGDNGIRCCFAHLRLVLWVGTQEEVSTYVASCR
jgi:hypothetical protein